MKDIEVLTELEQVKAMSVPVRVEIVKALGDEPMTTTQVARLLGEKPNRLYYHVTELERVGILQVVETRQRGNLVEKYYQPVARFFRVDPRIFQQGVEGQEAFLENVISNLDSTIVDIRNAIQSGELTPSGMAEAFSAHMDFYLEPELARGFAEELKEVLYRWKERTDPEASGRTHLTIVFYTRDIEADTNSD